MNGNFRKPEYVKRYEYTYFDLETPLNAIVPNNARQRKDNYRFVVDNTSEANPIDWYNAYLEVDFQLVTLADSNVGIVAGPNNGNQDATTTNGNTFIKEIQVECNGTSVYTNMKANEATNALTLLKYTKSYADSVGKDQFFYVDTSTGTTEGRPAQALYNEGFAKRKILTDASAVNKISIPLNQYSYFAAFKNQIHPNIKTNILIKLEDDANIIFRKAAAPDSKVIVTKMRLWCPKIIFNGLHGGSVWTSLFSLGTKALPFVTKGVSKVAPHLATGALSALGSLGIDKIFGSGMQGGAILPDAIVKMLQKGIEIPVKFLVNLINMKEMLTNAQKTLIGKGLQSGKGIVLKPTKRQIHGGFLGTLAAIGIPMAIELASKIFGSGAGQGLQTPRKAGGKGLQTPRKAGTGLQVSQKPFLWQPPPFYGTWEGQGRGAKGKGLLLGDNSPFNHIPILGAIL